MTYEGDIRETSKQNTYLPSTGGGGGGGGSIIREYDTLDRQNLADGGMGKERIEFK